MIASDIDNIVSGTKGSKNINIERFLSVNNTGIETTLSVIFGFLKTKKFIN